MDMDIFHSLFFCLALTGLGCMRMLEIINQTIAHAFVAIDRDQLG